MLYEPGEANEVWNVAIPFALSGAIPRIFGPLKNVTCPVGATVPMRWRHLCSERYDLARPRRGVRRRERCRGWQLQRQGQQRYILVLGIRCQRLRVLHRECRDRIQGGGRVVFEVVADYLHPQIWIWQHSRRPSVGWNSAARDQRHIRKHTYEIGRASCRERV